MMVESVYKQISTVIVQERLLVKSGRSSCSVDFFIDSVAMDVAFCTPDAIVVICNASRGCNVNIEQLYCI